ncbi:hypothetical protein [Microcoleus sp. FACHB-68]|nr:hypothetical protein [Microcoleus sp. FACHB-68]
MGHGAWGMGHGFANLKVRGWDMIGDRESLVIHHRHSLLGLKRWD